MQTCSETAYQFPPLPLPEWEASKITLHLFTQIIGKIRLGYHPKLNHWWHVSFYPSARGITTGRIPYCEREFEIEFDFIEHVLHIRTSQGDQRYIPLPGLTVAAFYQQVMETMASLDMPVSILPKPYLLADSQIPFAEDSEHHTYNAESVHRWWLILEQIASIFEEFRGQFTGKSTPVHLFWHSFDLALTRFSGKSATPPAHGTRVDKEAYSHEVISFGFWAGDTNYPQPAFYSYAYPLPPDITQALLKPDIAFWGNYRNSDMALMNYEDFRQLPEPRRALLDFLESAYQAGANCAGWPIASFRRQDVA